ncbi:class II histocompatibility antigen, B-L beta chain-like [Pseudopipra pipra]|uniref:class II histocompatibility antigen, B-L beta chain-like n=1 Tax=Pseudopipra pipra TaxID=415032 RepID=UPI00313996A9
MVKKECYFINGTERVRHVGRFIYNREQYVHFDSDVGVFVGDTPRGEKFARNSNSDQELLEDARSEVDRFSRRNYEISTPFLVNRRVPPSVSISLVPSGSQPGPGRLLCSGMDFYPAPVQVRWFQDGQELLEHVVATDVVPNGDWTYQVLVLLEIPPPARGHLQLPGGARQPGAPPQPALGYGPDPPAPGAHWQGAGGEREELGATGREFGECWG